MPNRRLSLLERSVVMGSGVSGGGGVPGNSTSGGPSMSTTSDRTHRHHRVRGIIVVDRSKAIGGGGGAQIVVESSTWCVMPKQKLRFEADEVVGLSSAASGADSPAHHQQQQQLCSFAAPPPHIGHAISHSQTCKEICHDFAVNAKSVCVVGVSGSSSRPVVHSVVQCLVGRVFDLVTERAAASSGFMEAWTVAASVVAIADNSQCKDLLASSASTSHHNWARMIITDHPMTGPFVLGASQQRLRTAAVFDGLYSAAVQSFLATVSSDAKAKGAVIASQITLKRVRTASGAPPESAQVFLSSMLCVDFGERHPLVARVSEGLAAPGPSTLAGVVDILHLLSGITNGSISTCAVVASLADDDEPNFAGNCLAAQQKMLQLNTAKPASNAGRVNDACADAESGVADLENQLKAPVGSMDTAQRRKLERLLTEKRANARTLRTILSAACGLRAKVIDKEKCEKFAQMFRMAYAIKTHRAIDPNFSVSDLDGPARGKQKEELDKLNAQLLQEQNAQKVLRGERDRALFQVGSLQRDLREERSRGMDLAEAVKKLKLELHEAHMHAEVVEKDLGYAQLQLAESNTQRHRRIAELEEAATAAAVQSVAQQEAYQTLQIDVARISREATDIAAQEQDALRRQVASLEAELAYALRERDVALEALDCEKKDLALVSEDRSRLTSELQTLQSKFSVLEVNYNTKVERVRELHRIECEAYLNLIAEGQALVEEFRSLESMAFTVRPHQHQTVEDAAAGGVVSVYRGGPQEVTKWLAALGLGSFASTFISNGFDTTHMCSLVTESDLVEMKVTAGVRRRILFAASELAKKYSDAFARSTSLFASPSCSASKQAGMREAETDPNLHFSTPLSLGDLVSDLEAWLTDFGETIRAETHSVLAPELGGSKN